jgi:hypothetical protein
MACVCYTGESGLIAYVSSFTSDRRRLVSRRDRSECMKPASDQAGLQDHPIATLRKGTRNEDERI